MPPRFHVAGVEVTQGLQYYHSWHHLGDFEDRYADNALPLVAKKRTWVRAYIESDSGYTADIDGTVLIHGKTTNVWKEYGPLKARATCKPYQYGTKSYDAIRGSLGSSLNFDVPWDWIGGEMRIYVKASDGTNVRDAAVWIQAPVRQTLKIAGIMVRSKTVPAPDLAALAKTAWKAERALPVSHTHDFRVVSTITIKEKLSDDASWGDLHDKALAAREADGNRSDYIYYVLLPPKLIKPGSPALGMEWLSDGIAAGRAMVVDEGYDALMHEIGHACGLPHAPFGGATDPDKHFPRYLPYAVGSIGEYGLDVVDGVVMSPLHTKDIMGYGDYPTDPEAEKRVLWLSPHTYRKLCSHYRLNPLPVF
jgi:hypothetical protein